MNWGSDEVFKAATGLLLILGVAMILSGTVVHIIHKRRRRLSDDEIGPAVIGLGFLVLLLTFVVVSLINRDFGSAGTELTPHEPPGPPPEIDTSPADPPPPVNTN